MSIDILGGYGPDSGRVSPGCMSPLLKIFSPSTPQLPPAPTPPIRENTAQAAEAARQAEVTAQNKRRGRAADLLTGAGGVTASAPTVRKQLLGA